MIRPFLHTACALIAMALAACSNFESKFSRESRAARRDDPYSGTYEGKWISKSHPGGNGKLWCILSKQEKSEYLAEFKATWHGVFSSTHSVVLHTRPAVKKGARPPVLGFDGTAAISMIIGSGTYQCEGRIDGRRLEASYDATYDRGTFELLRVPPADGHASAH